jgi:branched-chain amino acid transport system ATP-binding protein
MLEVATATFPALGKRLKSVAGSLSGGEQQMLAVTRAYLSKARVVLVDEASLGLAPQVIDELFECLLGIVQSGVALVLVEQYVTRALAMSDDVYLLNRGSIVYSGPTSALRGQEVQIFDHYLGVETLGPTLTPQ